jgi:predicted SprT family Zn-dependent metalloprotease
MIVMNINGVYKNSNNHSNVVAQTLLHELLHSVTVETVKRSPELRNELQHLLDKVRNSAEVKQLMA